MAPHVRCYNSLAALHMLPFRSVTPFLWFTNHVSIVHIRRSRSCVTGSAYLVALRLSDSVRHGDGGHPKFAHFEIAHGRLARKTAYASVTTRHLCPSSVGVARGIVSLPVLRLIPMRANPASNPGVYSCHDAQSLFSYGVRSVHIRCSRRLPNVCTVRVPRSLTSFPR